MKEKWIAGILILTVAIVTTGCGKQKQLVPVSTSTLPHETVPPIVTAEPKSSALPKSSGKPDYAGQKEEAVNALNEIMEQRLPDLMDQALLIQSEGALNTWLEDFEAVKREVGTLSGMIADLTPYAPEAVQASQAELTVAAASIEEALSGFDEALQAAFSGDSSAFMAELNQFAEKLQKAKDLWNEAL